jgi:acyl carrier protein
MRMEPVPISPATSQARSPEAIRALLLRASAEGLALIGMAPEDVADDFDLREAGVVDSLGFLELVTALEDQLGIELDFEALDPEQLTTVGPLVRHVAEQAQASARDAA